ncbi:MAG: hypothetical protein GX220_07155 [Treponema sp.]|nr:hypothetical protein [Treponema sp.]
MSFNIDNEFEMDKTIDDTSELERYGIWVRNAPRDFEDIDFFDDETTLSLDELNNITSADSFVDTPNVKEEISSDTIIEDAEISIDEFLDSDDFNSDSKSETTEISISDFSDGEIDLDAFMSDDESPKAEKNDEIIDEAPIDIDLEFDDSLSVSSITDPMDDIYNIEIESSDESSESIDIEDFDDFFDNIVDENETIPEKEVTFEDVAVIEEKNPESNDTLSVEFDDVSDYDDLLSSLDSEAPAIDNKPTEKAMKTTTDFDISVSLDDDIVEEESNENSTMDNLELEDVSLFDSPEIDQLKNELENSEDTSYNFINKNVIDAQEDDELEEIIEQAEDISNEIDTAQENQMDDMNRALLDKIVNEISALRNEFISLRDEFNLLKSSETNFAEIPTDSIIETTDNTSSSSSGFFDDIDDEVIALSGDELNNILENADFITENFTEDESSFDKTTQEDDEFSLDDVEEFNADTLEEDIEDESTQIISSDDFNEITEEIIDEHENEVGIIDSIGETSELFEQADEYEQDSFATDDTLTFVDNDLVEPTLDDLDFSLDTDEVETDTQESAAIDNIIVESSSENLIEDSNENNDFIEIDDSDIQAFDEDIDMEFDDTTESLFFDDELNSETIQDVEHKDISQTLTTQNNMNDSLKQEVKQVLSYMDQLLEDLPEEKIAEFAKSEHFETYKKLFKELGLS